MARRKVRDLMKGGLRRFESRIGRLRNGSGLFEDNESPTTVEQPCRAIEPKPDDSPSTAASSAFDSPPPTKPWLYENPAFRDQAFFDEFMAILEENRAKARAEAIAEAARRGSRLVIILDTNILSHRQKPGDPLGVKIKAAMAESVDQDFWITSVTVFEVIDGAAGIVNKAAQKQLDMIDVYFKCVEIVKGLEGGMGRILSYDAVSLAIFNGQPKAMKTVGKPDRRIAAIAVRHKATLWTRNLADFKGTAELVLFDPIGSRS